MTTDTERLDWLERNLLNLYHARQTNSVYMDGNMVFGSLNNEAKGSRAGPRQLRVKSPTIRKAIDEAMLWKVEK